MATESATVLIKADDKASKKFKKVGKNATKLGSTLKLALGAAGAFLGLRAIKNFAQESIKLFGEQERVTRLLSDSLDGLGAGGQAAMKDMTDFASGIQMVTTMGDEAVLELAALGASMGGLSGVGLKQATIAAIGFSKSLGIDTKAAMTLIAKAAQGNTTSFSRYGIQLDKNMSQQEKFQAILKQGAEGFKLAEGEADTLSGKIAQMGNTWGDIMEKVGEVAVPLLTKAMGGLQTAMDGVSFVVQNFGSIADIAVQSAKLAFVSLFEDLKHWFTETLPAYLNWFGDNWTKVFRDVAVFTGTVFSNMWKNIAGFFKGVWSWLSGDGFDFEWTSLTDGFQKTMDDLPKIAARGMSELEKELTVQIASSRAELSKVWKGKDDEVTLGLDGDTGAIVAVAGAGADKGGKAGGRSGLAAREARFLTGTSGPSKTELHTGQIVRINERLVKLTEQMIAVLKGNAGGAGPTLSNITLIETNMA